MTYRLIEMSEDDGRPIELYEFRYTGSAWYYTSSDRPVVFGGNTYIPHPIGRTDSDESNDASQSNIDISVARDNDVAKIFKIQPPSEVVTITIYSQHDLDPAAEYTVIWKGRIVNTDWQGDGYAILRSESFYTSFLRVGLTPRITRQCRVALYSAQCKVSQSAFRTTGAVISISGTTVTVGAAVGKPTDWFAGGMIIWNNNTSVNVERRAIKSSVSATGELVLNSTTVGLSVGDVVDVLAGCNHTTAVCRAKFNNIENYRGFPYIPNKSPFGGTSIF